MRPNLNAILGVVDYETTKIRPGARPKTRFIGLTTEREGYQRFPDTASLARYLSRRSDLRLYHHHDFDPCQAIVDKHFPTDLFMRGGRILRCRMGESQWYNSYALFPDGLAKILDACGFRKLPLACEEHEAEVSKKNSKADYYDSCLACKTALGERNISDCSQALAAFLRLGREYEAECGIDPVRAGCMTAAAAAFKAAEMHAGPLPLDLENREAYRGGRTEAFRLWDCGEADYYDINSSYPFAFLDLPERDWLIHARVWVSKDDAPRPFFMENDRKEGLIFPAGRFTTWFTASNYERYYAKHSGILRVQILEKYRLDLRWLKRLAPMIGRIYRKRQECEDKPAIKYALKIFLNSIYGRLGMRPVRIETKRSTTAPAAGSYFRLGPNDYLSFQPKWTMPKANYGMAAAITDNARARLYDGARRLSAVHYMDTDSLYPPKGAVFPLPTGRELGAWKFEKSGRLRVTTVKDYEFAGETHRKGGKRHTIWTVKLALNREYPMRVDKKRRTRYSKRRVRYDGSTQPLTV